MSTVEANTKDMRIGAALPSLIAWPEAFQQAMQAPLGLLGFCSSPRHQFPRRAPSLMPSMANTASLYKRSGLNSGADMEMWPMALLHTLCR